MSRYIDADAMKADLDTIHMIDDWGFNAYRQALKDYIDVQPTADVEPVRHGRWKRKIIACGIGANWKCSLCGKEYPFDFIDYDYCPNCGARMDEKEQENE